MNRRIIKPTSRGGMFDEQDSVADLPRMRKGSAEHRSDSEAWSSRSLQHNRSDAACGPCPLLIR